MLDTMDFMFACGLGFKCAEEAVLGSGNSFSQRMLAELEEPVDFHNFKCCHKSSKRRRASLDQDYYSDEEQKEIIPSNDQILHKAVVTPHSQKDSLSLEPLSESKPFTLRLNRLSVALLSSLDSLDSSNAAEIPSSVPSSHSKTSEWISMISSVRKFVKLDFANKLQECSKIDRKRATALALSVEQEIFSRCFEPIHGCNVSHEIEPSRNRNNNTISKNFRKGSQNRSNSNSKIEPFALENFSRCWRIISNLIHTNDGILAQVLDGDLEAVRMITMMAIDGDRVEHGQSEVLDSQIATSNQNE